MRTNTAKRFLEIQDKLGYSICTCGSCGAVMILDLAQDKDTCPGCGNVQESCDCPELFVDQEINRHPVKFRYGYVLKEDGIKKEIQFKTPCNKIKDIMVGSPECQKCQHHGIIDIDLKVVFCGADL